MGILDSIESNLINGDLQIIKYKLFDKILNDCCRFTRNAAYASTKSMMRRLVNEITIKNLLDIFELTPNEIKLLNDNNLIHPKTGDECNCRIIYGVFEIPYDISTIVDIITSKKEINIKDYYIYNNTPIEIIGGHYIRNFSGLGKLSTLNSVKGKDVIKIHEFEVEQIAHEIRYEMCKYKVEFSEKLKDELENYFSYERVSDCKNEITNKIISNINF